MSLVELPLPITFKRMMIKMAVLYKHLCLQSLSSSNIESQQHPQIVAVSSLLHISYAACNPCTKQISSTLNKCLNSQVILQIK